MTDDTNEVKKYEDIHAHIYTKKLKNSVIDKLTDILSRFNRLNRFDISYTCVKELIINATKAITKRIFFAENNLNIDNIKDWEKGAPQFKKN